MSYNQFQTDGFLMPNGAIQRPVIAAPPSYIFNANPNSRLRWTPELHHIFVIAIEQLGGATKAKPTAIIQAMERMGVDGLTLRQVKSHLQKHRNKGKDEEGEQLQDAEDTSKGQSDGTLSTVMVPTPDIGEQEVHMGEARHTEVGRGILEEMEVEDYMQGLKGAQDPYVESFVDDPYDMAIRAFFNA